MKSSFPMVDFDLVEHSLDRYTIIAPVGRRPNPSVIQISGGIKPVASFTIESNLRGVLSAWGLKRHFLDDSHSLLAMTFLNSTLLFSLAEEQDIIHDTFFRDDVRTICFGNLESSGLIAQVYDLGINICRPAFENSSLKLEYVFSEKVSLAAIAGNLICVYHAVSKELEVLETSIDICGQGIFIRTIFRKLLEWEVSELELSNDGLHIGFGLYNGTIVILTNFATALMERKINIHGKIAHSISFHEKYVYIGTRDGFFLVESENRLLCLNCGTLPASIICSGKQILVNSDNCFVVNRLNDEDVQLIKLLMDSNVHSF